jgi:hypothetical protein
MEQAGANGYAKDLDKLIAIKDPNDCHVDGTTSYGYTDACGDYNDHLNGKKHPFGPAFIAKKDPNDCHVDGTTSYGYTDACGDYNDHLNGKKHPFGFIAK